MSNSISVDQWIADTVNGLQIVGILIITDWTVRPDKVGLFG